MGAPLVLPIRRVLAVMEKGRVLTGYALSKTKYVFLYVLSVCAICVLCVCYVCVMCVLWVSFG